MQLSDGWWGIPSGHAPFLMQRRSEALPTDHVLVLTAAAEKGNDLAVLEHVLNQHHARMSQIAQEAHIEFARAQIVLERALRETGGLAPLRTMYCDCP